MNHVACATDMFVLPLIEIAEGAAEGIAAIAHHKVNRVEAAKSAMLRSICVKRDGERKGALRPDFACGLNALNARRTRRCAALRPGAAREAGISASGDQVVAVRRATGGVDNSGVIPGKGGNTRRAVGRPYVNMRPALSALSTPDTSDASGPSHTYYSPERIRDGASPAHPCARSRNYTCQLRIIAKWLTPFALLR